MKTFLLTCAFVALFVFAQSPVMAAGKGCGNGANGGRGGAHGANGNVQTQPVRGAR
jgi:hypothetical protein